MMGRHHALLGVTLWTAPAIEVFGVRHWHEIAASSIVCGAAAMLPDIDEPGSTVAHVLEPVSGLVSKAMNEFCGGHRQASHSLLAVGIIALIGWGLTLNHIALAVASALLVLLAFRGLAPVGLRHGVLVVLIAGLAGVAVALGRVNMAWFPIALSAGYTIHLLGDMLTSGGVPLLWPDHRRIAFPVLSHTNSMRETVFAISLWFILSISILSTIGARI